MSIYNIFSRNTSINPPVEAKCLCCEKKFKAKQADIDRGWAKCCSKSCSGSIREFKNFLEKNVSPFTGRRGGARQLNHIDLENYINLKDYPQINDKLIWHLEPLITQGTAKFFYEQGKSEELKVFLMLKFGQYIS